jgi:hypothetical protein
MVHCNVRIVVAKSMKLNVVKEIIVAIVNAEGLIGPGRSCAQQSKTCTIGFNTFAKRAKAVADFHMFIL